MAVQLSNTLGADRVGAQSALHESLSEEDL